MENIYGLQIRRIERTCSACPSQWEGEMVDGRSVYIRYRWGRLTVGIGNNIDEAIDSVVFDLDYGDLFDGAMNLDEVLDLTGMIM